MTVGENKFHPLEIEDARSAAHQASELQRGVEDRMREAGRELAEAERAYRKRLTERIVQLKAEGVAVTACETIAKGEADVAELRYRRDIKKGMLEAVRQEAYRRGADRADVGRLLDWSMKRDLRVDAEPPQYPRAIGAAA